MPFTHPAFCGIQREAKIIMFYKNGNNQIYIICVFINFYIQHVNGDGVKFSLQSQYIITLLLKFESATSMYRQVII